MSALLSLATMTGVWMGGGSVAQAIDFEGSWPSDERVSLRLQERPALEIVRQATRLLDLELAHTAIDNDPTRDIDVADVSLQQLLTELYSDRDLLAIRDGDLLLLREARTSASPQESPPETEAVPPQTQSSPSETTSRSPDARAYPPAGEERDRVSMGGNIHIRSHERVRDVVSFGGNIVVEGIVTGDVTTTGGNLTIRRGAEVHGDLVTMGGNIEIEEGADVRDGRARVFGGRIQDHSAGHRDEADETTDEARVEGHNNEGYSIEGDDAIGGLSLGVRNLARSAAGYLVLFVFGLILMGAVPERYGALRVAMAKNPGRSLLVGILGYPLMAVAVVALCLTLIGIPIGVGLVLLVVLAHYVGLVAGAHILGGILPIAGLRQRPIGQLAAGVFALFVITRVPFVGGVVIFVAVVIGFGAILRTRFRSSTAQGSLAAQGSVADPSPKFPV